MATQLSTIIPQANAVQAIAATWMQVGTLDLTMLGSATEWLATGELWCAVSNGTPNIVSVGAALSIGNPVTALSDPATDQSVNFIEPNQSKASSTAVGWVLPLSMLYTSIALPTTVYLNARVDWTGVNTNLIVYGKIAARGLPVSSLTASGNFVYLHLSDGSDEGYVNVGMAQLIAPNAAGGSRLRVENRVINVIEAASDILGAMS
jgi:hypothetical protein